MFTKLLIAVTAAVLAAYAEFFIWLACGSPASGSPGIVFGLVFPVMVIVISACATRSAKWLAPQANPADAARAEADGWELLAVMLALGLHVLVAKLNPFGATPTEPGS